VIVDIGIDYILSELDECEKGRLIFKLLADAVHCDSGFVTPERIGAIKDAVRAVRRIFRERWTWDTCGLSREDAELFGWEVPTR